LPEEITDVERYFEDSEIATQHVRSGIAHMTTDDLIAFAHGVLENIEASLF